MRKLVVLMLIVAASAALSGASSQPALARAAAHSTPSPAPTPIGPEDPAASKVARQQFVAWQVGALDRTRYTDDLNKLADDDQVSHTAAALRQLGALQSMEWLGYRNAEGVPQGSKTYVYKAHCANGSVLMQFSLAPDGKIAGMIFRDNLTDF